MSTPSAAALSTLMKRLKGHEQDLSDNVQRQTAARRLREASDAGIALVRPLADGLVLPQAIFDPDQQIVTDVTTVHHARVPHLAPGHPRAAALREMVNARADDNVLPRVISALAAEQGGTAAEVTRKRTEVTRKLKAVYIATRVRPIAGFRGPLASRAAKTDEMQRLSTNFDQRLARAREATASREAEAARAHAAGHGGRRRSTRQGRKRTVRKRGASKRMKRRTRRTRRA